MNLSAMTLKIRLSSSHIIPKGPDSYYENIDVYLNIRSGRDILHMITDTVKEIHILAV